MLLTIAVRRSLNGFDASWTVSAALTYTWVAIYLTFVAIALGKFAVIAFILSLQGITYHRQRLSLYFLALSNITINVILVLFLAFRCSPVANQFILGATLKCTGSFAAARGLGYFAGCKLPPTPFPKVISLMPCPAWNATTDLFLAAYPIYLFYNLKIDLHVKTGILCVMSLGLVACGVACVKTKDLTYVVDTEHLSYQLYCILNWSYAEVWCVIITCSIPPLWPLVKRAVACARMGYDSAKAWISAGNSPLASSPPLTLKKDVELLKYPQANPRSTSLAAFPDGCIGRPGSTHPDSSARNASHVRAKSSTSRMISKAFTDTGSPAMTENEEYEIHEPERGFMTARDVARPGIIITREYSVGSEKRKEERAEDSCQLGEWGTGKPMRHNWDDPASV